MSESDLLDMRVNLSALRLAIEQYSKQREREPLRGNPKNEYERGFMDGVDFLAERVSPYIEKLEQQIRQLEGESNQ
jgi:hypothetical protein